MKLFTRIALATLLIPCLALAQSHDAHQAAKSTGSAASLSPELRSLLSAEMRALQDGMQAIIPAYSAGQWGEIERIAGQMESSYILKQSLTTEQVQELHGSLSPAFIEADEQFHYLAGMLKHVAAQQKTELVGFYFSRLADACASCHAQHAAYRFVEFAPKKPSEQHSH